MEVKKIRLSSGLTTVRSIIEEAADAFDLELTDYDNEKVEYYTQGLKLIVNMIAEIEVAKDSNSDDAEEADDWSPRWIGIKVMFGGEEDYMSVGIFDL